MIEIRPDALYSRTDLVEMLAPLGVDADTFIARLKPRKVFRQIWFGRDLLDALEHAEPLADRDQETPRPAARRASARRGNRAPGQSILDEFRPKVKPHAAD